MSSLRPDSAFLSRLRESDHPFLGWLPPSTLAMGSSSVPAELAASEPAAREALWIGSGEAPFVFLFPASELIPQEGFAGTPVERDLWEKMIGALGFSPQQARLGVAGRGEAPAGAVQVGVGISEAEGASMGLVHLLPSMAALVRDASLKRPAWKVLQDAASAAGWKIPAPRGSR